MFGKILRLTKYQSKNENLVNPLHDPRSHEGELFFSVAEVF